MTKRIVYWLPLLLLTQISIEQRLHAQEFGFGQPQSGKEPKSPSMAGASIVSMTGKALKWPLAKESKTKAEDKPIECHNIAIATKSTFGDPAINSFHISRDERFAIAIGRQGFDNATTIYRVDLEKDEVTNEFKISKSNLILIGASPSCKRLVMAVERDRSLDGKSKIEVIDLEKEEADTWIIEGLGTPDLAGGILSAQFIDENRFLTVGPTTTEWDFTSAKALRKYHRDAAGAIAFSIDGKLFACGSNNRVGVYDLSKGKSLGSVPYPRTIGSSLLFSCDGSRLAIGRGEESIIVHAEKGPQKKNDDPLLFSGTPNVHWITDRFLLEQFGIYDLVLGANIWRFQGDGPLVGAPMTLDGRNLWYAISKKSDFSLVRSPLPMDLINELSDSLDPKGMRILPTGSDIALELDLPFNQDEVAQICNRIEGYLNANGIKVVSKSKNKFIAKVEKGSRKRVTLKENGTTVRFEDQKDLFNVNVNAPVEFTPTVSTLSVIQNDKVAWKTSMDNNIKSDLEIKKGESVQQAVSRASAPQKDFFMSTPIPRREYTIGNGKIGTSILSIDGIR